MYSQLALASNRATADGLKIAASNFCFAAGVMNHLKLNVDATIFNNRNKIGMGYIIIDSNGGLVKAQSCPIMSFSSPREVKSLGVHETLS